MATPMPPLTPDERLAAEQKTRYDSITRNLAIGGAVLCPIIALLPPRKLDLYTFSLGVGFYLSADHLAQQRTGKPLVQQFSFASPIKALPTEKAQNTARILKEKEELEKSRREELRKLSGGANGEGEENRPFWNKVWMGDESEGWKERRMEEERKALEEGKTYTDIIFEQIWDVWNWNTRRSGAGKGGDEEKKE